MTALTYARYNGMHEPAFSLQRHPRSVSPSKIYKSDFGMSQLTDRELVYTMNIPKNKGLPYPHEIKHKRDLKDMCDGRTEIFKSFFVTDDVGKSCLQCDERYVCEITLSYCSEEKLENSTFSWNQRGKDHEIIYYLIVNDLFRENLKNALKKFATSFSDEDWTKNLEEILKQLNQMYHCLSLLALLALLALFRLSVARNYPVNIQVGTASSTRGHHIKLSIESKVVDHSTDCSSSPAPCEKDGALERLLKSDIMPILHTNPKFQIGDEISVSLPITTGIRKKFHGISMPSYLTKEHEYSMMFELVEYCGPVGKVGDINTHSLTWKDEMEMLPCLYLEKVRYKEGIIPEVLNEVTNSLLIWMESKLKFVFHRSIQGNQHPISPKQEVTHSVFIPAQGVNWSLLQLYQESGYSSLEQISNIAFWKQIYMRIIQQIYGIHETSERKEKEEYGSLLMISGKRVFTDERKDKFGTGDLINIVVFVSSLIKRFLSYP